MKEKIPTADELRKSRNVASLYFSVKKILSKNGVKNCTMEIDIVATVSKNTTSLIEDDKTIITVNQDLEINKVYFIDETGLIKPEPTTNA